MLSNLNPFLARHTFYIYILKHTCYIFKFMLKIMKKGKPEYRLSQTYEWSTKLNI